MTGSSLDERLAESTVGALELFGVYIGTRLGLYRVLHERPGLNAVQLSEAAGIAVRYAQEWLEQQAVAEFLAVDDPAQPPGERRYRLPEEHVGVLVQPEDAAHVAPFADMVVGVAQALDDVVDAYRSGSGVPYSRYGPIFRGGQGAINRPAFTSDLTGSWLPASPGAPRPVVAPRGADRGRRMRSRLVDDRPDLRLPGGRGDRVRRRCRVDRGGPRERRRGRRRRELRRGGRGHDVA